MRTLCSQEFYIENDFLKMHTPISFPLPKVFENEMMYLIGFSLNKTWLPVNPNYKILNLKNEMKSSRSHYIMYKRLVEVRKHPAIQNGSLNISILSEDILLFSR
jgi:hypothetical protein